ncbi:MAG: DNA translocase FtsK 4TM domain-containing protein [bacterium]|nr:DNA translocase FtsK 4TM domain-containing protein [bacterium]
MLSKIFFLVSVIIYLFIVIFQFKKRGLSQDKKLSNYIIFIFLFLISLFLFISFYNYDFHQYQSINREKNLGGIAGYFIAEKTFGFLGVLAFFLPTLLLYSGLGLILNFRKIFFPSILSITQIALIPILVGNITNNPEISGVWGDKLSSKLSTLFGNIGLTLILSFLIIIPTLLLTNPEYIFEFVSKIHQKISKKKEEETTEENDIELSEGYKNEDDRKPVSEKKKKKKKVSITSQLKQDIDYRDLLNDQFKKEFLDYLEDPPKIKEGADEEEIKQNIKILEEKLKYFSVEGKVVNVNVGPVITTYEFEPAPGIKVNKITSLSDDLALAMKAKSIRVLGHIPGKSAVGIEIPNRKRVTVFLKGLLTEKEFLESSDPTTVVMGRDTENNPIIAQISSMPHLLIAGTTGSGKSVCINGIIASILFKAQPEEVRFLMVDPKRIELSIYNGIPHLERPVITDAKEAVLMLKELAEWMDLRYKAFAKLGVRDIVEYNKKSDKKKPYIIVIIDEMADLMMTGSKEIETHIIRLAQMSRAVGIHLILATQRPSVNIITGSIKANFPVRISFKVPSKADSKTIIDTSGAEKLLGKGDMLYIPPQKGITVRAHGAFIKTEEATNIVNLWAETYMKKLFENEVKDSAKLSKLIIENELIQCITNPSNTPGCEYRIDEFVQQYSDELEIEKEKLTQLLTRIVYHMPIEESGYTENIRNAKNLDGNVEGENELDPLFEQVKEFVSKHKEISTSMIQSYFKLGYPRAAKITRQLEKNGIIGPANGSKPRKVLVYDDKDS